jgi:hypothetical protein
VGDRRVLYRELGSILECKRPLGIPRSRWEDKNNMHLQVKEWSVDRINLAKSSDKWPDLVINVMKLRVAENERNSLIS